MLISNFYFRWRWLRSRNVWIIVTKIFFKL